VCELLLIGPIGDYQIMLSPVASLQGDKTGGSPDAAFARPKVIILVTHALFAISMKFNPEKLAMQHHAITIVDVNIPFSRLCVFHRGGACRDPGSNLPDNLWYARGAAGAVTALG